MSQPLVPGLPALRELMRTPAGRPVLGFTASGDEAVEWWQRLRDAHPGTGLWPVLMDDEAPEYLVDAYAYEDLDTSLARVPALDGAALLAGSQAAKLKIYGPELTAEITAALQGAGDWPDEPERRGSGFFGDEPALVALVPATDGWMVPAVLHYGGWNDFPIPAEHAAILRYWHERFGAELVSLTGTTAEFAVARPPATRLEAAAFAWEYMAYNDGAYDFYFADTLTELAGSLQDAPVWRMWWD
ncbi:DUF4253 domain-containing protein [Actinoplanes bogorensis]|uniref:DUF4253 domain-containing protein n=1 Tax=Paractinoplanes bogorensis TaxID=1610840 RepID=A0ABS5YRE8_9ACTN|nr:DUF4253 domain-containing protein [Actinoplanes bogorensis]MBU2665948.1 DUF4253 domain-containing protein [Actinoplanes bogorensis]